MALISLMPQMPIAMVSSLPATSSAMAWAGFESGAAGEATRIGGSIDASANEQVAQTNTAAFVVAQTDDVEVVGTADALARGDTAMTMVEMQAAVIAKDSVIIPSGTVNAIAEVTAGPGETPVTETNTAIQVVRDDPAQLRELTATETAVAKVEEQDADLRTDQAGAPIFAADAPAGLTIAEAEVSGGATSGEDAAAAMVGGAFEPLLTSAIGLGEKSIVIDVTQLLVSFNADVSYATVVDF